MLRNWRKLAPLTLLALALVAVGCEQPTTTSAPDPEPQALLGGLLGGGSTGGYTLVKDPLLPGIGSLQVSQLIGVDGGEIHLLGHSLRVPAGAVASPTLFSLLVMPTGYVEVELNATVETLLAGVLDVGGKGFLKPVPVTLTYSRATNVTKPRRLVVVRINSLVGYGNLQAMPSTVDLGAETVTAQLDHFSRYALATPF